MICIAITLGIHTALNKYERPKGSFRRGKILVDMKRQKCRDGLNGYFCLFRLCRLRDELAFFRRQRRLSSPIFR